MTIPLPITAGPNPKAAPALVVAETGGNVVQSLRIADGFWSRFVGLQFAAELPAGHGLLLVPCNSVHTCFVRFPLDLVFLDRQGEVLAIRRNARPWRVVLPVRKTHAVLELPTDAAARIEVGQSLRLRLKDSEPVPASVRFLTA